MATRTLTLTNTLNNLDGTAKVGARVDISLQTPGGIPVKNLEGAILFNGQSLGGESVLTNSSGVWTATVTYPGDLRDAATGATTTCQLVISEAGQMTVSPVGFTYASSITVSTWYPSAAPSAATLRMLLQTDTIANAALQGASVAVDISATAVVTATGVVIPAGRPQTYTTDAGGAIAIDQVPSANLTPTTTTYVLTFLDSGTQWFYTVPTAPTGYLGAYAGGTTYHSGDVVSSGGVYYQAIATTTGNAPPNVTYWVVWPGEQIDLHLTTVAAPGALVLNQTGIAHTTNAPAIAGDLVASPTTLDDDVRNLAGRTRALAVATKTTTYTATSADDLIRADATSAGFTVRLPASADYGRVLRIGKVDSSVHAVTISPASGTINGASTLVLGVQYAYATLVCDGTNWHALVARPQLSLLAKTTTYSMTAADDVIKADATGAAFTVTLPASAVYDRPYRVIKVDSSGNAVTVAPASGTVNGAANLSLASQWAGKTFICDGTNWLAF